MNFSPHTFTVLRIYKSLRKLRQQQHQQHRLMLNNDVANEEEQHIRVESRGNRLLLLQEF